MQEFTNIALFIQDHQGAIGLLFGGGLSLSILLQWLMHRLEIRFNFTGERKKKVGFILVNVLSLVGVLADYFLANGHGHLGQKYAFLVVAAQAIHRFLVSPFYNKTVIPYLDYKQASKPAPIVLTTSNDEVQFPTA